MCYSHFGNGVRNVAIDCYEVNPIGQWGKILVMAMGFVDHLGPCGLHIIGTSHHIHCSVHFYCGPCISAYINLNFYGQTASKIVLVLSDL